MRPATVAMSADFISPYRYFGDATNIVDGDSVDVKIDLGFHITREDRVRLKGIDAAEIHFVSRDSDEFLRGLEQKTFVEDWFRVADERAGDGWPVIVETEKDGTGKYGRLLADFYRRDENGEWTDDVSLSQALIDEYGESVRY